MAVIQRFKCKRIGQRVAAWTLGILLLATVSFFAVLLLPCLEDPSPGFLERRGTLVEARETLRLNLGHTVLTELRLVSSSGLEVEISLRIPTDTDTPSPLVILLGGYRTGRDAARLVVDTRGVVVAALSYPYRGNPATGGLALLARIPDIQRAILDTPPAVLLTVDYLLKQPYVDPERIHLIGVSLGAFFVSVPAVLDPRIRRVWLIHGGGKPAEVLAHRLEGRIPLAPVRHAAGRILALMSYSRYLEPERWVGRIAPRPVILVNARDDDQLTASSIESLHRAVREPAEIVWTEGEHVLPTDRETVERITGLILERLARDDGR